MVPAVICPFELLFDRWLDDPFDEVSKARGLKSSSSNSSISSPSDLDSADEFWGEEGSLLK